jgi:hypothetical protein
VQTKHYLIKFKQIIGLGLKSLVVVVVVTSFNGILVYFMKTDGYMRHLLTGRSGRPSRFSM